MRLRSLMVCLILPHIVLGACGPGGLGRIEPVVAENADSGWVRHRLVASTNCAEVGELVVLTAEITNTTDDPLTIVETPPLDIIIRPYRRLEGGDPVQRWSETDQYPADMSPVLAPQETRTYTWRWIADKHYVADDINWSGATVEMPLTVKGPRGGQVSAPLSPMVIGVKLNPTLGGRGVLCADLR